MAENFVELGASAAGYLVDKHWDHGYDSVARKLPCRKRRSRDFDASESPAAAGTLAKTGGGVIEDHESDAYFTLKSSRIARRGFDGPNDTALSRDRREVRDSSLERESQTSEQVIRAYRNEPSDPCRKVESVLPRRQLRRLRQAREMSQAGGYPAGQGRNNSQPPRSRYYDDDDSDYDERTGRRYRTSGRGYDDREDDPAYDREVIETERYRGPARPYEVDRQDSYRTSRSFGNEGYGEGAVAQYRRSDDRLNTRRSRSRGRHDRDRSYSRSRSRSRSGSRHSGFRGKLDDHFDTTGKGLAVGLAGAVVGGLAGRQFGHKHKERDIIIGALVGGLGANAAEHKYREWKGNKERNLERDEERLEQRWDGGRSRSAMR